MDTKAGQGMGAGSPARGVCARGAETGVRAGGKARVFFTCALALLLAAVLAGVGGTWALANSVNEREDLAEYFDAKLAQKYADEPVSAYPGSVVEHTAIAENTGAKTMWVRMSIDKYWMEKDGDAWKRVESAAGGEGGAFDTDYIIVHMNESAWTEGDDGWWYCNETVEPGAKSATLFDALEISTETGEEVQGVEERESMYATHAASVDVKMECTAEPDPVAEADSVQAKFGTTAAASKPDTGDALPWMLYLAAAAALAAALVFFLAAWRRRRGKDDEVQVVEFTL